jgi:hypothetical protein
VLVVLVDLELDVVFRDPGAGAVDVETRVLVRHLLDADHDLHRKGASKNMKRRTGNQEHGFEVIRGSKSALTLTERGCDFNRESARKVTAIQGFS